MFFYFKPHCMVQEGKSVYEAAVNKKPTSCWRQECGRKRSLHLERGRSQPLVSLCKVAPPSLFLLPSPTRYAHVLVKRTGVRSTKTFFGYIMSSHVSPLLSTRAFNHQEKLKGQKMLFGLQTLTDSYLHNTRRN